MTWVISLRMIHLHVLVDRSCCSFASNFCHLASSAFRLFISSSICKLIWLISFAVEDWLHSTVSYICGDWCIFCPLIKKNLLHLKLIAFFHLLFSFSNDLCQSPVPIRAWMHSQHYRSLQCIYRDVWRTYTSCASMLFPSVSRPFWRCARRTWACQWRIRGCKSLE